jgi:hypothetical protein
MGTYRNLELRLHTYNVVFWVIISYNLVPFNLKTEAAGTSETLVPTYRTIRRHHHPEES